MFYTIYIVIVMRINDVLSKDAVRSMTIPETIGAGLLGGVADSALTMTIGTKIPTIATAGIEIAAGLIGGGLIKGTFGGLLQNGLVINGCSKIVNIGTAAIMSIVGGNKNQNTASAAANSGNTSETLY